MKHLQKIFFDFRGLSKLCGTSIAFRWIFLIFIKFREILQRGDLQPADQAMGIGPFLINSTKYHSSFQIAGNGAISGIREMYIRDTYLHEGLLRITNGDTVVDLGANMGNFTNLALASGANLVIAVEPSFDLNKTFKNSVGMNNGYLKKTMLIRAFLGSACTKQLNDMAHDANYSGAPWINEDEFIKRTGLKKINFLKM